MTSHSSIFSSDTLSEPVWRLFNSPAVWVVFALVLTAESIVRLSLPAGVQVKGAYHSIEFRQQVEQYPASVPVDMLVIGSSVAAGNYPPVALDGRLREWGLQDFTTFNTGIRGCNYTCIAAGVERFYLPVFVPENVLVIISPEDLNHNNLSVMTRSERFLATMQKDGISRWVEQKLSAVSYLYGFQAEVKDWLTSGVWSFDTSRLRERGYIDMGSVPGQRYEVNPGIDAESSLSQALTELVTRLAAQGSRVILLPVEGDSQARLLFGAEARQQQITLLDNLVRIPGVKLLDIDPAVLSDDAYIDTIHLSRESARTNAQTVADRLFASGWLIH